MTYIDIFIGYLFISPFLGLIGYFGRAYYEDQLRCNEYIPDEKWVYAFLLAAPYLTIPFLFVISVVKGIVDLIITFRLKNKNKLK